MSKYCKKCDLVVPFFIKQNGPHLQSICTRCNSHIDFIKQNNSNNRESKHKNLVKEKGIDYCEWCLRKREEIPLPGTLEAHHIVEYSNGGTDQLNNILILCTACHKQCHHDRTYYGHYNS
jgi:hypothetical protein